MAPVFISRAREAALPARSLEPDSVEMTMAQSLDVAVLVGSLRKESISRQGARAGEGHLKVIQSDASGGLAFWRACRKRTWSSPAKRNR